jgi:hypothetical protein
MAQFRTSRTFDVYFLLVLAAFLWWAAINRIALGDWIYFLSYQPNAETIHVADEAGLSPFGRKLFYRGNPQFASLDAVNQACDIERLGCITGKGEVFILDDPSKPGQTIVTAAHEMLHLAYRRLPQAKKDDLAPLLDQAVTLNTQNGIADELRDQTSTDDRRDEAHSLLATEYRNLPPQLEQYYKQYFTDRSKVIDAEVASSQP